MFEIYTDGATSNNGYDNATGGYAWYILKDGQPIMSGYHYIKPATNNICELYAIIRGCEAALELGIKEPVVVYSDSAYCINCYKQKWYKNWEKNGWKNAKRQPVANRELWELLIPFFENENFTFEKVKGHADNKWNNAVDELAVQARKRGLEKC